MTVEELLARCDLVRASEKKLTECKPFSCGEGDLDEFFEGHVHRAAEALLGFEFPLERFSFGRESAL